MKKAVVIIVFNRPDLLRAVIRPIRQYAPDRVYLIADGPRSDRLGEGQLCFSSRAISIELIDWKCEVVRIFSDRNLGCRDRVVTGLDEVFSREPDAIVMEDDTVASDDFFPYCERMLDAHERNERIFSITGTKLFSKWTQQDSAFLSRFTHIWGWATWRRSWLRYDRNLSCIKSGALSAKMLEFLPPRHVQHWERVLTNVHAGRINTWDYQLQATAWMSNACCLTPPRNLISNQGFRPDATHTAKPGIFAEMKTYSLVDSNTTFRETSSTYDWLFQNMFHNPNRPLRWARACLAYLALKQKADSRVRPSIAWKAAKQPL